MKKAKRSKTAKRARVDPKEWPVNYLDQSDRAPADLEFDKLCKEHFLTPNLNYGSVYLTAKYWFYLGLGIARELAEKAAKEAPKA